MTDAQTLRHQLRAAGYCPIPLYGKEPPQYGKNNPKKGLAGWQKIEDVTAEMLDMWAKTWPDAINTGCLCRTMPTLDADILDAGAASHVAALVRERYEDAGYVLARTGKPPKFAIPFRTEEPFEKITANLIAPDGSEGQKIEFLGDGQQVVVAGEHPDTKQPYRWSNGGLEQVKLEDLPYTREAEARALVEDIVALLIREFGYKRAPGRPKGKANGHAVPHDGGGGGDRDWGALTENILTGRELHDSIAILAAKLIASGMNSGAAVNYLRGLMDKSTATKDDRWRARVSAIPAAVDSAVAKWGKQPEPAAEQPKKPAEEPQSKQRRFKLKPFGTITIATTPSYRVKGILPRVGLVVVWGPPKCGKSFWTFDLVMHVATGRPYRGRRVQQGVVVYLALEGGSGFAGRIEAWRQRHLAEQPQPVPFYLLDVPVDLVADHKALIAAIREQVVGIPAVVVIDTLNRALLGDENKSDDMAKFIRAADAVRAAFNCLIIVVHHCGIVGTRPRGHTSLAGADDAQIAVERDKDGNVIATVEHMKDAEAGAVLASKLEKVDLGTDADGDSLSSCIAIPTESGTAGLKLTKVQRFAFDLLQKLITTEGVIPPAEADLPDGFKVCLADTWRKRFYETYPAEKQDTKKKALLRATLDLEEAKLIVLWREYVWVRDRRDKSQF